MALAPCCTALLLGWAPLAMGLYCQSWLMVYWMYTTHRPEFVRFQKLLVSGHDPTKA